MLTLLFKFLIEDENDDFIIRPDCFHHLPSVSGLDFLTSDLGMLLDTICHSITNRTVHENEKI